MRVDSLKGFAIAGAVGLAIGLAAGLALHTPLGPWMLAGVTGGLLYRLRHNVAANVLVVGALVLAIVAIAVGSWGRSEKPASRLPVAEMRNALYSVVYEQERHFNREHRFAADLAALDTVGLKFGRVHVRIDGADDSAWVATAEHEWLTGSCTIYGGRAGDTLRARLDSMPCRAGQLTEAYRTHVAQRDSARTTGARDPEATDFGPSPDRTVPPVPASCQFDSLPPSRPRTDRVAREPMDFGYPVSTVDRLAVRQLLFARSYAALDRMLDAYTDSARRDVRLEYRLFDAYRSFDTATESFATYLDEWVLARPASSAALLARATWQNANAWHVRGTRVMRRTAPEQVRGMTASLQSARADVMLALERAPCSVVAYHLLMIAEATSGGVDHSRALLDEALAIQPYSFLLRARHMYNLMPRWRGSYAEMRRFAFETDSLVEHNPRLRALHGFPYWDRAHFLGKTIDTAGTIDTSGTLEEHARALNFGDFWDFRLERGRFLYHVKRYAEALVDLDRAVAQRPQHPPALELRSQVLYALGFEARGIVRDDFFARTARDIELAAELDPVDPQIVRSLAFYRENIPTFLGTGRR